ncbi:hypothetical protein B5V88_05970 [Heyndrickxia sporothermodurans]|uniref:V-type ATP synthase subunit E n=1 Tax=Heyndrickxia sporothermodurans TaxID=46224 RepID=A0AB37HC76_9BACI|nr:hypothetical protein [Heyndrickxia sporothermodurans]MBL5766813.1 hypothetical protein [Heyndrickxia sporothermodurans]MBL5771379.1 hypothetical protein [Heyndrickxia sporothermodurans]MBL5774123.1 hypothetical protein [Heyndrickxia sporothermodurans]MBL5777540.1 hypothetical protein [Heyndrickxia sporothermodurans]MBL5781048.1 hypothetical protein [Heyndrickxia sporothermodurans]
MENNSILKDTIQTVQQEIKTMTNQITSQITNNISQGFEAFSWQLPRTKAAAITSKIKEFQVDPQIVERFLKRKNELKAIIENMANEKLPVNKQTIANILDGKIDLCDIAKIFKNDKLNVVKSVVANFLIRRNEMNTLVKTIDKNEVRESTKMDKLLNKDSVNVSELKKQLNSLVDRQIQIETSSGTISGTLLSVEQDYIIVGYTTLIPLNRIEAVYELSGRED